MKESDDGTGQRLCESEYLSGVFGDGFGVDSFIPKFHR